MNHPETTKPQDKQSICLCSRRAAHGQATLADVNVCVTIAYPLRVILDSFFSFSHWGFVNFPIGIVATSAANLVGFSGLQACHSVGWQESLCKLELI